MKFVGLIRRYLPLWVALDITLALLIGYYFPQVNAAQVAVPFLLFVMLYPMMLNLRLEHIGNSLKSPRLVIMAILLNFIITPLLGALWAQLIFSRTDPYLASGFILKVLVPGSGMVAAWTGYARGKVESGLVIVALSLILSIFLVPVWMMVLAGTYIPVDPFMIFQKMLLVVVLPLIAGIITRKFLIRKYGTERFQGMVPYFAPLSTCGMLPMVFIIIAAQAGLILSNFHWVGLVILGIATLYPILFLLAIIASKVTGTGHGDCMALGFSVTAKGHAITIGIATTAFAGTLAVLPAAVAPIIQIPIMLLFLQLSNKIERFLHSALIRKEKSNE
jgi:ACR3 family arsenite efflux pump ArsB